MKWSTACADVLVDPGVTVCASLQFDLTNESYQKWLSEPSPDLIEEEDRVVITLSCWMAWSDWNSAVTLVGNGTVFDSSSFQSFHE